MRTAVEKKRRGAAAPGDEPRRWYTIAVTKNPEDDRDRVRALLAGGREFYDCIGADTPEDDVRFPVGADCLYALPLTAAEAASLARDGEGSGEGNNVRSVDLSVPTEPGSAPLAPLPATSSLRWMRADPASLDGSTDWHGRDVTVAVLDQGTTQAVRDRMGCVVVGRQNFGDVPANGAELHPATDGRASGLQDHGCLVAPNAIPTGGRLLDMMVVTADGRSSPAMFAAAVRAACDQGAKVINYSFGAISGESQGYVDAMTYAATAGAEVFVSAMNDNQNVLAAPASYSRQFAHVHSVIAFDERNNARASFSNYASDASECAPGVGIVSLTPTGETRLWDGTSAASPLAASDCARGATGGRFTTRQVGAALKANTRDTGQLALYQGGGAVDLRRALIALGAIQRLPIRQNPSPRPSVEVDATGHSTIGTSAPSAPIKVASGGRVGPSWASVTASAAGTLGLLGPAFVTTAGRTHTPSVFMRRARAGTAGAQCYIQWFNAAGTSLGYSVSPPLVANPGTDTWHRLSHPQVVAPTSAATGRPMAWLTDVAANEIVGVDGWLPEVIDVVEPYFDGSFTNAVWDGAVNESTSTLTYPAPTPPQAPPVIRSSHSATGSTENATITTSNDTRVGDLLVVFHAGDWDTAAALTAPTGTSGTWTLRATGDRGTNATHVKLWTRPVTVAGAQRVTVNYGSTCDIALIVLVIDGSTLASSPFDGATQATGVASKSHVAASVTPGGTADLLLAGYATSDSGDGNKLFALYTAPPNMRTALAYGDNASYASTVYSDQWISMGVFSQSLTAAGATGTRTAACDETRPWAAVTLALRGAVMAVPVVLDGTQGRPRSSGYDGVVEMTGRTYDAEQFRARSTGYRGELAKDAGGEAARPRVRGFDGDLEHRLDGSAARLRALGAEGLLDNLTGAPVRVRCRGFDGVLDFVAVTALTASTPPVTTRPRKRLRFYAQEVLSRRMVSKDVGLAEPKLTWKLNKPTEITGKISAKELRTLGVNETDLFIHAELDGAIRASGILTPSDFSWGGPEIDIVARGVTSYLAGQTYDDDWTLRGETGVVGQQLDPLDIVRHLWAYVQRPVDGRLGVVLSTVKSTARLGEPEKTVAVTPTDSSTTTTTTTGGTTPASTSTAPATGAATTTDGTAEQTTGPWVIKWWEDSDLGRIVDDLAKTTPFDFRELPYWNADRTDVIQFVELGWPRCGRSRTDLVFAEGENLTHALTPVMNNATTAGVITVLGKGEGSARTRATYGAVVPGRLRRTVHVERKDVTTTAEAFAHAKAEWPRRQGYLSFDEVHIKAIHRNAPLGSFLVADDIPVRARVQGFGQVLLKHRVEELAWDVMASNLTAKTRRSDTYSYGSSALTT